MKDVLTYFQTIAEVRTRAQVCLYMQVGLHVRVCVLVLVRVRVHAYRKRPLKGISFRALSENGTTQPQLLCT